MADREITPWERGVLMGREWASENTRRDDVLRIAASGALPDAFERHVLPSFRESLDADIGRERAFRAGFLYGIRAVALELERSGRDAKRGPDGHLPSR